MKTIKFLFGALLVAVFGLFFTSTVKANTLKNVKLVMADSQPSTATNHTFSFNHTSGASVKKLTFQYCKTASDPSGVCPVETGTTVAGATRGTVTGLGTDTDWGVTVSSKVITLYNNTVALGAVVAANDALSIQFGSITNGTLAEACDAIVSTDTCFVWIKTYTGPTGATLVDEGTATYTLVDSVVVTARVDPTFTFVIQTVGASTVNNQITTSVASSANSLPFGSLTAGIPKYAAHALYVTTNSAPGYYVTAAMNTQMTGVVGANNIDPFVAPWGTPTTWTLPTGTVPNTNTAWVGANTTDTDVTGWNSSPEQKFGSISSSAVNVSQKSSSDNGLTPVYVTYVVEANVFQPSDFYTGALTYNAIPTY